MVLKIINHGDDVFLPIGNGGNYNLKRGMEWINPPAEALVGITTFPNIEVIKEEAEKDISKIYSEKELPDIEDGLLDIKTKKPVADIKAKKGRPRKNA